MRVLSTHGRVNGRNWKTGLTCYDPRRSWCAGGMFAAPVLPGRPAAKRVLMSTLSPFRIPVADLLRRPGAARPEHVEGPLAELSGPGAEVATNVAVTADVTLERVPDG